MNIYTKVSVIFLMALVFTAANADHHGGKIVLPVKTNKADAAGMIFSRDDMTATNLGLTMKSPV
jgi:hypothetical protein